MKLLKIVLISSAMLAIVACSPKVPEPKMETEKIEVAENEDIRADLQHKLTFDKDILFVQVKEVNNEALHERPMGGISSQDAYVKDGKELYMFYDAELPNKKTNMIVMKESRNHDYLLSYELLQSNEDVVDWEFEEIDNEYVNNDNRLFLGNKVIISELEDGIVNVTLGDQSVNVNPNGEDSIVLNDGDVNSEILIVNYGYLNSIKDMTYERLLDD